MPTISKGDNKNMEGARQDSKDSDVIKVLLSKGAFYVVEHEAVGVPDEEKDFEPPMPVRKLTDFIEGTASDSVSVF